MQPSEHLNITGVKVEWNFEWNTGDIFSGSPFYVISNSRNQTWVIHVMVYHLSKQAMLLLNKTSVTLGTVLQVNFIEAL